jgi:hypothetical protein
MKQTEQDYSTDEDDQDNEWLVTEI